MKIRKILAGASALIVSVGATAGFAVLEIGFDNFPNETAFGMWTSADAPAGADSVVAA